MLKNISVFFILLFQAALLQANTFPESFCTFQEAVYAQKTHLLEIMRLYTQAKEDMEREDLFNLYLMLEVACIKLRRNEEAKIWHEKAASLYPTNNFISVLIK